MVTENISARFMHTLSAGPAAGAAATRPKPSPLIQLAALNTVTLLSYISLDRFTPSGKLNNSGIQSR